MKYLLLVLCLGCGDNPYDIPQIVSECAEYKPEAQPSMDRFVIACMKAMTNEYSLYRLNSCVGVADNTYCLKRNYFCINRQGLKSGCKKPMGAECLALCRSYMGE